MKACSWGSWEGGPLWALWLLRCVFPYYNKWMPVKWQREKNQRNIHSVHLSIFCCLVWQESHYLVTTVPFWVGWGVDRLRGLWDFSRTCLCKTYLIPWALKLALFPSTLPYRLGLHTLLNCLLKIQPGTKFWLLMILNCTESPNCTPKKAMYHCCISRPS